MISDWNALPTSLQLHVARQASRQASDTIARQAEILAADLEVGALADRGGADALKLLASIVRAIMPTGEAVAGHA